MKFPEITKKTIDKAVFPAFVETKVDGALVGWNGQRIVNERGYDKTEFVIPDFVEELPANVKLWGELYYGDGKEFYSEIHSHQQKYTLKVAWFDVVELKGQVLYGEVSYRQRRHALAWITEHIIPAELVVIPQLAQEILDKKVEEGYEGVVVKPCDDKKCDRWVKLKRFKTVKLYVKGIKKGGKRAIAIGTLDKTYGACSIVGWEGLVNMIAGQNIVGSDKEYYYVEPKVVVEVQYQALIPEHNKLRNPFLKRICTCKEEITIPA